MGGSPSRLRSRLYDSAASSPPTPASSRAAAPRREPGSRKRVSGEVRSMVANIANRRALERDQRDSERNPFAPPTLSHKDKILRTMDLETPTATSVTTSSITMKWQTGVAEASSRIQLYDVQWRIAPVVPEDRAKATPLTPGALPVPRIQAWAAPIIFGAGSTRGERSPKRVPLTAVAEWTSIDHRLVDRVNISLCVESVPEHCPPLQFRVRAKAFVGWGRFSEPSKVVQTLGRRMPRPERINATSHSVKLKWRAIKDPRYGRIRKHAVYGRKSTPEAVRGRDGCKRQMQR
jgi:hypothetical protein